MGRLNVQFACHHCGHCCTEVICLPTPWDVIRIVKNTGKLPLEFLEFVQPDEIEGVAKNDATWLEVGKEKYMMALKRDLKGCNFLDKKTRYCTIYEHRPLLCRLYPFKLHETRSGEFKAFSLHEDVGCPKNRDGLVSAEVLHGIYSDDKIHHEGYRSLVEAFNQKDYPGKKAEDFLDLFVVIKRRKTSKN